MIALPIVQAEILTYLFEEFFNDSQRYLDLIDIEEIFALLIGGEVREDFTEALEQTAYIDEHNLVFLIFIGEWMDLIEQDAIGVEYYELAANAVEFKRMLTPLIYKEA